MAGHDLIDAYLAGLAERLRWRADRDDVIDELRDHLYSSLATASDGTGDDLAAQQQLLDRFGQQHEVARAMATTPRGGVAVPTASTRALGVVAMLAAALWLVFPLSWLVVAATDGEPDLEIVGQIIYMAGTLGLIAAAGVTVAVAIGIRERLGGLGGLATIGLVFLGLATAAGVMSWFFAGWASLTAVGAGLFGAAMLGVGIAPRLPTALVTGAWAIGVATWAVLRALEFGGVDEWGDYPLATLVGLFTGSIIFATGLGLLGRWLHGEEPAFLDPAEPAVSS